MSTSDRIKVLVVEDNPGDFFLVQEYLQGSDELFDITHLETLTEAKQLVANTTTEFDIILLDLSLPDSNGPESVRALVNADGNTPIIVLTGFDNRQYGIDSLKMGAQDYLIKDEISSSLLVKSIRYSIERNTARKEMSRQDRLFRVIMENSVYAKVLIDEKGFIIFGTASMQAVTGFESKECVGRNERDMLHPADVHVFFEHLDAVVANPDLHPVFELRVCHKQQSFIWCKISLINLLHDEHVKAVVGTFWDISKEKESEAILKASEDRYRYLFNNNPASIFIWYPEDMTIAEINDTAVQQYGYTREEMLQLKVPSLRPPEDRNSMEKFVRKVIAGDVSDNNRVLRHIDKLGHLMFMQFSAHRIMYNNRAAILSIGINVTEKLALEHKLEQEKIKKGIEITAAVISAQEQEREEIGKELHDNINQILASSRLYLGLVKSEEKKYHPSIDEADMLVNSAIEEIRILSHSLIPPSMEQDEFTDAIDSIIEVSKTGSKLSIKKYVTGFEKDKMSDKMRLTIYRIVQEQFNNILKHSNATEVRLELFQDDDQVELNIKDNGKGFNPAEKANGIGFMNIKTRASLYNGDVNIISAPGEGTELNVCFHFV